MYFNPYLQDRLADQSIQEALQVAKVDYLLKGDSLLSKHKRRKSPRKFISLSMMILLAPFQWGASLLRKI